MRNLIVILAIAIGFSACKKEEGEGGSSVIKGKVYQLTLRDNNGVWDTLEYKLDTEKVVYIIYSNNENDIYDDSFDTHWNGEYRFEFLRKGDYTIYTYANFDTSGVVEGVYPVFKHIKIDANNKTFSLDDFVILKDPS